MASRPRCDRPCRPAAIFFRSRDPRPAGSGGAEGEHPLDVPCHGHEAPLATHLVEPAQQELAESEDRFDDAEHWFPGSVYAENRASCLLAFSADAPWPRPALGFSARAVDRPSARPEVDDAAFGPWRSPARSLPLPRPPPSLPPKRPPPPPPLSPPPLPPPHP